MKSLKTLGALLLGITAFIGIITAIVLLFTFGSKFAFAIAPYVNWLASILFIINLLLLVVAIAPKARAVVGLIIYISSYIYGLSAWIYGLAVTLSLWGWVSVIIGLFIGGVGIVPIGILAAIFHGEWGIFWTLLLTVILTYGARIIGSLLIDSTDNMVDDNIIDIEPEDDNYRTWKDLE